MTGNGTKRPAPAFQCYAASRLADRGFKSMSAVERGILHSIECECWVNGSVPCDRRALARVLGLDQGEVETGLTDRVLRHLEQRQTDEAVFIVPELESYRQELEQRRTRMSEGGKQSAAAINKRRHLDSHPDKQADSPLVQDRTDQSKTVVIDDPQHQEFVRELEAGPEPDFMTQKKLGARIKPGIRD